MLDSIILRMPLAKPFGDQVRPGYRVPGGRSILEGDPGMDRIGKGVYLHAR